MPFAALHGVVQQHGSLAVRFAAVMYPAAKGAGSIEAFCSRLRAERECAELLELVVRLGPAFIAAEHAEAEQLLALFGADKGRSNSLNVSRIFYWFVRHYGRM